MGGLWQDLRKILTLKCNFRPTCDFMSYVKCFSLTNSLAMWRWRKSEQESGGHSAVSATTKWVQFKLQNMDHFTLSLLSNILTIVLHTVLLSTVLNKKNAHSDCCNIYTKIPICCLASNPLPIVFAFYFLFSPSYLLKETFKKEKRLSFAK